VVSIPHEDPRPEASMETFATSRSFPDRMKGAAFLDIDTYEDVEHDVTATSQAAGVVAIVAVCSAIGGIGHGGRGIIGGLIGAFIGWLLWSGVTYLIGDKLFDGTATWGELLRTIGFAQTPGIIFIFGIVPLLGWIAFVIGGIWMLVTGIVAIRQALDFSTGKAIGTALLGWIVVMVIQGIIQTL
jgi:hypothetical protein